VLFVSHNMKAVQGLCQKAIWIDQGRLVDEGAVGAVVSRYLQASFSTATHQTWPVLATAPGNEQVRLHRVCVRPRDGSVADPITVRTPFVMEFEYWNLVSGAQLSLSLHLYNEQGILVFNVGPVPGSPWEGQPLPIGLFRDICYVPGDLLNDGTHRVDILVIREQGVSTVIYQQEEILVFDVRDDDTLRGDWYDKWPGTIRPLLEWQTELVEEGERSLSPTRGAVLS
jgi:lipopolysaccharide transport system ATP-binding protein